MRSRRCTQSRIGAPITSTAIPSPAHHCNHNAGHQPPELRTMTVAPIRPPASGPRQTAPATNPSSPDLVVRSGRPPQNLTDVQAPASGSTQFAAAEATATPGLS